MTDYAPAGPAQSGDVLLRDHGERQYAMILHLSSLAGYLVPYAGLIVPVALWLAKKDESPGIDRHGRAVVNATISYLIYTTVAAILCVILIGIPMLILLGILAVVFPIIAAVKANDGRYWNYPGSIRFL